MAGGEAAAPRVAARGRCAYGANRFFSARCRRAVCQPLFAAGLAQRVRRGGDDGPDLLHHTASGAYARERRVQGHCDRASVRVAVGCIAAQRAELAFAAGDQHGGDRAGDHVPAGAAARAGADRALEVVQAHVHLRAQAAASGRGQSGAGDRARAQRHVPQAHRSCSSGTRGLPT